MNLFSRLAEILDSQLDGAEQPAVAEDSAAHLLEDLQECLAVFKEITATAIAERWRVRRNLVTNRTLAAHWARRAHAALGSGDGIRSQRALAWQRHYEGMARELQLDYAKAKPLVQRLRLSLDALEQRLARLKYQQHSLIDGVEWTHANEVVAEFDRLELAFQSLLEECRRVLR